VTDSLRARLKETVAPTSLSVDEVADGYDVLIGTYPYAPSLALWRGWELAAYRRIGWSLPQPVLDVGCGDGQFFRLVWPEIRDVVGVDQDPAVAALGQASGVYQTVVQNAAHALPFRPESFASCFANCSLEHMDHLSQVLSDIARVLRPGAPFLLSVVTDKFLEWSALSTLVRAVGEADRAEMLLREFEEFHHLRSPFPPEAWQERLHGAGFECLVHIPILPELSSRVFLLLDETWHIRGNSDGELGGRLFAYLSDFPEFPRGLRTALRGVLEMERDWTTGSGAVFLATKSG
jgi:SAM-dependent methyltransferase